MRKNLIYKQISNVDNVPKTIIKLIPVEIPDGTIDESWNLVGECDAVEFVESKSMKETKTTKKKETTVNDKTDVKQLQFGDKYISSVGGTARLVRVNQEIIITRRKGNATLNQNDPNSVCIDDLTKTAFFSDCRSLGANDWKIAYCRDSSLYNSWSSVIDKTYLDGLNEINQSNGFSL